MTSLTPQPEQSTIPVPPPFVDDSIPMAPPAPPVDNPDASIGGMLVVQKSPEQLTPQDKFLQREMLRLDQALKARANVRKYFVECRESHTRQLLTQQEAYWAVITNLQGDSSADKVKEAVSFAFAQIRQLRNFLGSDTVMENPKKFELAISTYTREELYQLLIYFKEAFPEPLGIPMLDVAVAVAAQAQISAPVNKYYKSKKEDWINAFIQHPKLSYAIVDDLTWRSENNEEVTYAPRPYSEALASVSASGDGQKEEHKMALEAAMALRRQKMQGLQTQIIATDEQMKKVAMDDNPGKGGALSALGPSSAADQLNAKRSNLTMRFKTLKRVQFEDIQIARDTGLEVDSMSDDSSQSVSGDLTGSAIKIKVTDDDGK
jgi:hypothetical protein